MFDPFRGGGGGGGLGGGLPHGPEGGFPPRGYVNQELMFLSAYTCATTLSCIHLFIRLKCVALTVLPA